METAESNPGVRRWALALESQVWEWKENEVLIVMSKEQCLRENAQSRGQLKELPMAKAGTIWVVK